MFRRAVSYLWSTFGRASYAVCEYKFQPIRKEPRATRTCKAAQPASPFSHGHVRYQGMSISVSLSMTVFARITNVFRSVAHLSDIPTDVDKFSLFPYFSPYSLRRFSPETSLYLFHHLERLLENLFTR